MTGTLLLPELAWKTILFNCNCHTFDDVIDVLSGALGCSEAKASQLANIVHDFGSAVVYNGPKEKCEVICDSLGKVGLFAKVTQ